MGLIDLATAPLRYVINEVTEHEAEVASPLRDIEEIQTHVLAASAAIREATGQIEKHVAVIETLVTSLEPLTAAVAKLADQMQALPELSRSVSELTAKLDVVAEVLTPLALVEQDAARVGHLFSRRRSASHPVEAPPPPDAALPSAEPSPPAAET
jgi:methyl-accepting chemotaxis protein